MLEQYKSVGEAFQSAYENGQDFTRFLLPWDAAFLVINVDQNLALPVQNGGRARTRTH